MIIPDTGCAGKWKRKRLEIGTQNSGTLTRFSFFYFRLTKEQDPEPRAQERVWNRSRKVWILNNFNSSCMKVLSLLSAFSPTLPARLDCKKPAWMQMILNGISCSAHITSLNWTPLSLSGCAIRIRVFIFRSFTSTIVQPEVSTSNICFKLQRWT